MTKELQDKLYSKYPDLFKQKDLPSTQSCMCWGIAVGDGWYNLIEELCRELTKLGGGVEAAQVKEKFGGLRFYLEFGEHTSQLVIDEAHRLENEYEAKSYTICETCGQPGKVSQTRWIQTICPTCSKKK